MKKPVRPESYSLIEGGEWFKWPPHPDHILIHAIKMSDGRIYDSSLNRYRSGKAENGKKKLKKPKRTK